MNFLFSLKMTSKAFLEYFTFSKCCKGGSDKVVSCHRLNVMLISGERVLLYSKRVGQRQLATSSSQYYLERVLGTFQIC